MVRQTKLRGSGGWASFDAISLFELSQNHLLSRGQVVWLEARRSAIDCAMRALGASVAILRSKDSLARFRDVISPARKWRHGIDGIVSDRDAS